MVPDEQSKRPEETSRQLCEMFLSELHQKWWAEHLAQLRVETRSAIDAAQMRAIEARILEHYRLRHAVELTRERLGLSTQTSKV